MRHGSLALPDVWRPGSFLCLILLSPLVIASVLSGWSSTCFRTPMEKNRKLAMEIELPHPSRHSRTLHTLVPLMPKRRGMTWNLSMCLTDVGSFLSDSTKPSVASDMLSPVFSFTCEISRPESEIIWIDVYLTVYVTPSQATILTL